MLKLVADSLRLSGKGSKAEKSLLAGVRWIWPRFCAVYDPFIAVTICSYKKAP